MQSQRLETGSEEPEGRPNRARQTLSFLTLEGEALREDLVAKEHRGMDIPAIARSRCGTDPTCDGERYVVLLCGLVGCE